MATQTQLREHRQAIADLNTLAYADIAELMRQVDDGEQARDGLMDLLPLLAVIYGSAAATLAADWYDDLRDAAGAAGRFLAIPAETTVDADRIAPLARWAVGPMFSPEPDATKAVTRASGGLQRIIANADRDTITTSVESDPAPAGWVRSASSGACAFCKMLATRDVFYNSKASATTVVGRGTALSSNQQRRMGRRAQGVRGRGTQELGSKYHDFCNCVAQPVWGDYEEPVEVGEWRAAYEKAFSQLTPGTEHYTPELLSNMRQILGTN